MYEQFVRGRDEEGRGKSAYDENGTAITSRNVLQRCVGGISRRDGGKSNCANYQQKKSHVYRD